MKDAKLFFRYTKMIFVGCFWIFILLLMPGCSPIETQSMQNEPTEDAELVTSVPTVTEVLINPTDIRASVTTQYSEPTPTLNSSPTPIIITSDKPTPIPVATLTLAERQVLFSELMATNGGCDLPCWWSIELGESLDRINQKFIDLGMPWLIIEESHKVESDQMGVFNAGYIDEDETRPTYRLRVYTEFHELDNAVDYIYVQVDRPNSDQGQQEFIRDWEKHYLSSFLQRYGKPTQVYFRHRSIADVMDPPQFSVSLLYREKGLTITYHIKGVWLDDQSGMAKLCLDMENAQAIELSLFNPDNFDIWGYQFAPYHDELYEPLTWETEVGTTLDAFYETYQNPENLDCLSIGLD